MNTAATTPFYKKFWFEELISIGMKLHPIILFALGYLDAKESFLVLVLGYLIYALRIQAWMAISFIVDYKHRVWLSVSRTPWSKFSSACSYVIGFLVVLCIWLFIYLIFFGLYYDAVARQYNFDGPGPFDGPSGRILVRTLWINGIYFVVLEVLHLRKMYRDLTPEKVDIMRVIFLNVPMQTMNKWSAFPMIWLMLFSFLFIFLCTGRAFQAAIILYFIYDIGFTFLKRLELRKNG